jgi:hypothetical protein
LRFQLLERILSYGDSVIGCGQMGKLAMGADHRTLVQRLGAGLMLLAALVATGTVAVAQGTQAYWISMRGVATEAQAQFVPISPVITASHTVVFAGCRGRNWYLEPGAAATVQAARSAGETLQIHRGPAGSLPSGSTVICLIQADG